jgi:hypothetical protein
MERFSTRRLSLAAAVAVWLALGAVIAIGFTELGGPRAGSLVPLVFLAVAALIIREASTRVSGSLSARQASADWQKPAFDYRYRDDRPGWASLHEAAELLAKRGYAPVGQPRPDGGFLAQRFERTTGDRAS